MHPVDHAKSSAVTTGLPVSAWPLLVGPHDWMDATKATHAYVQHRALRHHVEGLEDYVARHDDVLTVHTLDGTMSINTQALLETHLHEDLAREDFSLPRVADWLREADISLMPTPRREIPSAEAMAERSAGRFGGTSETWLPLHAWFLQDFDCPDKFADHRHLAMRHHAWGIFDAEAAFGHVLAGVPVRVVAESHVGAVMGRIPAASDWLTALPMRRWMSPCPVRVDGVKRRIAAKATAQP